MVVPTDSGIKSVKDLKGKGLTTQPKGNTGELITGQILQVNGLSYSDVKASFVSYTDSVSQMKDGHAAAFGLGTTIPAGAIMDVASSRDITLLDMADQLDAMRKLNPGYTLVTVPKGTYPKQDKDVRVIGYATHLVVSCKAPADTVYALTKTIANSIPQLANVVKAMSGLNTNMMAENIGVPFHAGAAKFYKEAGINVATN
jgi:hypothetical protein